MNLLKNKKGMTLVEIIIAFVILAILSSAFLLIFSSSLVNILNFGEKSKSLATANQALEAVYSIQNPTQLLIEAELDSRNGKKVITEANLYDYTEGNEFNYFIEPVDNGVSTGFQVTIVHFYYGGGKFVDLESFVRRID